MDKIKSVHARQLIDCKCRPMVEVEIKTENGHIGLGSAPTGTSVGMYESFILRDGVPADFNGLSVHKAVRNVNELIDPLLHGMDISDQQAIDQKMIEFDGTANKSRLGGNSIYSVSIAAFRAAAASANLPTYQYLSRKDNGRNIKSIPVPTCNVINGGVNAGICQPFNEFLIVPYKANDITEAVQILCLTFDKLGSVIQKFTGKEPLVGKSYGYASPTEDPHTALELIQEAVDECGYHDKVCFALDCASSEMFDAKTQTYYLNGRRISGEELINYTKKLTEDFHFLFIEDLLDENDWNNFALAVSQIKTTNIIGDDLIATNPGRLQRAYEEKAVQGFILKPNQVGTLTEAFQTYHYAKKHGMLAIPSGRAGGVIDDIVMDLSAGLEIPFQKNGAPRSGERIAKLNFLMRIADLNPECPLSDLSNIAKF